MTALDSANNLSDLASIPTALINLGIAAALGNVSMQKFDTVGAFSYTPNPKMAYVIWFLQGAGGGAGSTTGAAFMSAAGGAGSGGGAWILGFTRAQIDLAPVTGWVGDKGLGGVIPGVNSGTNGEATFLTVNGSTPWTAGGGEPGTGQACSGSQLNSGPAGGVALNTAGIDADFSLSIVGQHGHYGFSNGTNTNGVMGAAGGNSFLGSGGHASPHVSNAPGNNYGGGAGGGVNGTGIDVAGQNGAQGVAFCIEFCTI